MRNPAVLRIMVPRSPWKVPLRKLGMPILVDCICPKKLASRLISMLLAGTDEDDLLEDALYVLSTEGNRVRNNQSRLGVN
jgi:hypothetical protein